MVSCCADRSLSATYPVRASANHSSSGSLSMEAEEDALVLSEHAPILGATGSGRTTEAPVRTRCFFKMDVPASMMSMEYECIVACDVVNNVVVEVIAARCSGECPAGRSGRCVHVASVLIAAVNVMRPLQRDFTPVPTAHRCWWQNPGDGRAYNFLLPVCHIPFTNEDINKVDKKANRPCMDPALARWNINPYPEDVTYRARTNPKQQALIAKLARAARDDHKQTTSLEIEFPLDWSAGQLDTDHPLKSLREARRWKVLDGDYLADKGFRIHCMLARYNAGLYKPPHRLRGVKQLTSDGVRATQIVANMRIHVERDMRRAREFHILNKTIPIAHIDIAGMEAFVAFMLGNLSPGLTGKDFFDKFP